MHKNQPGVFLRFEAKPGMGQELFELCTDLHYIDDPDGPSEWLLTRDDSNPDVMWAAEFYRDQESFDRHYANPVIDERHTRIFDLLADQEGLDSSQRSDVHIFSSSDGPQP